MNQEDIKKAFKEGVDGLNPDQVATLQNIIAVSPLAAHFGLTAQEEVPEWKKELAALGLPTEVPKLWADRTPEEKSWSSSFHSKILQ